MSEVNNTKEFTVALHADDVHHSDVEKAIYKYTNCGAWITHTDISVRIGSNVDGVDQVTDVMVLFYPFEMEKFWEEWDKIENQAEEIWNKTHGCEDCGIVSEFDEGLHAINPECKTCKGEGIII